MSSENQRAASAGLSLSDNVDESDHGEVSNTRDRTQTKKYVEFQQNTFEQNFKRAVSKWRKNATQIEKIMSDSKDIATLRQERDKFENSMQNVSEAFEKVTSSAATDTSFTDKYEQIEEDNFEIVREIADCIRKLESERYEIASRKSNLSKTSVKSTDRVTAAAETAALKVKLQFMEQENRAKMDLEQKRIDLETTQTRRELEMAQAKLDTIVELEMDEGSQKGVDIDVPTASKMDIVKQYIDTQTGVDTPQRDINSQNANSGESRTVTVIVPNVQSQPENPSRLSAGAKEFVPLEHSDQHSPLASQIYMPTTSRNKTSTSHAIYTDRSTGHQNIDTATETQGFDSVVRLLTEQVSLNRLPPPEPGVFFGDPLLYPSWKGAFTTLVGRREIADCERIYYLKKYLGGQAKEAVEGYLLLSTDSAYADALNLLEQRYGDPFVIGNAFREKLDLWPKIAARDGLALRKLSDFLRQCQMAMASITSLRILDDDQENRKILLKLPDWLTLRWARTVAEWRERRRQFPPFSEFVNFITKEATIACDPVTSLQSFRSGKNNDVNSRTTERKRPSGHQSYATETRKTTEATQVSTSGRNKTETNCRMCKKPHDLDVCEQFLALNLEDRKDVAFKNGLCFGCLMYGHRSKDCTNRKTCKTCGKRHPTSLHGDYRKVKTGRDSPKTTTEKVNNAISHLSDSGNSCKCSMIVPVWLSHQEAPEKEVLVYALLDTQSDTTFILENTCDQLQVKGPDVSLSLSTMTSENEVVASRRIDGLVVRGHDSQMKINLPAAYSRKLMPSNRTHIPTPETARKWPHLEQIANKLMPLSDAEVGLLIGYNCSKALAPRDVIAPPGNEPYGQRTDLGWGIVGVVHQEDDWNDSIGLSHHVQSHCLPLISYQTSIKEIITPVDIAHLFELDFSEQNSDETALSYDDHKFLEIMKNGIHLIDGHYEMPLPLKDPARIPPNNRALALRRLHHLKSRFNRYVKYKSDYMTFMERIINDGYAEKVPPEEISSKQTWYIPHHGVNHPKKPGKIRVVFDCSAKYGGESLNDNLLQGPDLMNNLIGVLVRFRQEPVAFLCDIEQMFFQFRVDIEHRDMLRFLWWDKQNLDSDPIEFRMKVHLFGAASSPACANYGLKQAAIDNEDSFGSKAADFVRQDFYVDDGLKSVKSIEEAVSLINDSQQLCKNAGLRLHKFVSNKREVISAIPTVDRAQGVQDLDLLQENLPIERALGIHWCIESDSFNFRITLQDRPMTRRGILSTISSVYDPLGFLAPVILVGKQILQQLCKVNADWDSALPQELQTQWERWKTELIELDKLRIQRCYKPETFGEPTKVEIHHFSDASTLGYGQCSYLRLVNDSNEVHCSLLMGKARVTPLKAVTIPRLELTAALISVKVSTLLKRELEYENITEVFWTDSKIVLGYLSNDTRRFHVFVSNRVQQIRNHTKPTQWRYVSTNVNPADQASRGVSAQDFVTKSRWTNGPAFLWETEIPPAEIDKQDLALNSDDPEVKQVKVHATTTDDSNRRSLLDRLEVFSDWNKAKRAVAVCLRLKTKLRTKQAKTHNGKQPVNDVYQPCMVKDISEAETLIVKLVQESAFADEISKLRSTQHTSDESCAKTTSSLYRLDPFLDDQGVLRVGGRLRRGKYPDELQHPAILPKKHHVTSLIIRHFHSQVQHQGRGMTANAIRSSGFWIIGGRSEVSSQIFHCVDCRKLRSRVQEQKMADLPADRVEPAPPFTNCGVDYFGPWHIKEGRKTLKRYGVLFTCLVSRAIHIETAVTLTTDSFINALRRFLATRGPIRLLRSDQGTNFVGASRELREALCELNCDRIKQFLLSENCDYFEFRMNVPGASHMGGVWERQIRTVRNVLASLLHHAGEQLDDESLRTLMCEVTAIVNSRPLTTDTLSDAEHPEPLTPNHLLTMKTRIILPPPGDFVREDLYCRKRWRRIQHLANEFWTRWKREYLQTLQTRQRWTRPRRDIQVGDVVIIKDNNLPWNDWQLARVAEAYKDVDGHVRTAKLAVADRNLDKNGKRIKPTAYLERPVQKLVLLLDN